jgi:hypothetical protein
MPDLIEPSEQLQRTRKLKALTLLCLASLILSGLSTWTIMALTSWPMLPVLFITLAGIGYGLGRLFSFRIYCYITQLVLVPDGPSRR